MWIRGVVEREKKEALEGDEEWRGFFLEELPGILNVPSGQHGNVL